MKRIKARWVLYGSPRIMFSILVVALNFRALAQEQSSGDALADPLTLEDVLEYGRAHRQEIVAARARARAASQRPAIVSALEDPMVMPSIDHVPFALHGVDGSVMVEQRFPLSGILGHRRRAAKADALRFRVEADRVSLDIQLDVARSFFMLAERREMARVLGEQLVLARQFVSAANARYSAGVGNQAEVLRSEVEVSRLLGAISAIRGEVAGAEAMLNASLGRPADSAIPKLDALPSLTAPPSWNDVRRSTLSQRPELLAGKAEISRAGAEIAVMKSMYLPMGFVKTGPSYTMSDSWGWMLTVGVSIPLWRRRLRASVLEAEAMEDMARADLLAMARMAEGEAAAMRQRVLAARARVLALRNDIIPRARQSVGPSIAAYASGTIPLVSVVDAAQALWSVQAELISAEFELGLAWARLYRAQGQFDKRRHR